jgi:hypothetical protein
MSRLAILNEVQPLTYIKFDENYELQKLKSMKQEAKYIIPFCIITFGLLIGFLCAALFVL